MRYHKRTVTIMIYILLELPADMYNENPEGKRSVLLLISVSLASTADCYIVGKYVKPCLLNERIDALMNLCVKTLC